MHAFLAAPECGAFLAEELRLAGCPPQPFSSVDGPYEWLWTDSIPDRPYLAFARQMLPDARALQAASINGWADLIIEAIVGVLPDSQPWRLHLWPAYGEDGRAGLHRAHLIRQSLVERLKKRRRSLLRSLEDTESPWLPETSLVQLVLTAPDAGLLSVATSPQPFEWRAVISPFVAGEVPIAEDKAAPSRAFAKVIESELRLGQRISAMQTCVDLGASPGSWSYVALQRGAKVTGVDRSPLRDDLMRNPRLTFHQGDAFKFKPSETVDWLICDIIAAPQRSIDLLLEWLDADLMRHFIVTLKFKGADEYHLMHAFKAAAAERCRDFRLTRLCANKNEVCAFGSR